MILFNGAKRDLRRLLIPRAYEPNSLIVTPLATILEFAAARLVAKGDGELLDFIQSLRGRAQVCRDLQERYGFHD